MSTSVEYFFTPSSPWTHLGHERFCAMARAAQVRVQVLPVDYGVIFPTSGGLPLAKRAPQRQAYRLVELRRFSEDLGVPLNRQPKFFPVDPTEAAKLIVAVEQLDGSEAALAVSGALLKALWAEERNLADPATHTEVLAACGLPAQRLQAAREPAVAERFEANTRRAIDLGVFGAPSYVIDGEIFWGQDRLSFVERRLS